MCGWLGRARIVTKDCGAGRAGRAGRGLPHRAAQLRDRRLGPLLHPANCCRWGDSLRCGILQAGAGRRNDLDWRLIKPDCRPVHYLDRQ